MQVLSKFFIAAVMLAIPALSSAQDRTAKTRTTQQLMVMLESGDWEERYDAAMFVKDLGPQASAELRLAVIDAAWAEVRGETNMPNESEAGFDYMQAVAEMGDPRAIPFLVEVLPFGLGAANALADIGARSFPAVLEAVSDPDEHPKRVSGGLITLRFMLEDGILTAGQTEQVRAVVHECLSGAQDHFEVRAGLRLALAIGDLELRAIVERFANDRAFAEALVSVYLYGEHPLDAENHAKFVSSNQKYAQTLLDRGGAGIGPTRRPIAKTIH